MPNTLRLSVLLTFKNEREEAENTLTALLELERVDLELVVLDDGSTDGTRDVIHSLLDHYPLDDAYFYEHDGTYGRGNLLNEGLSELEGSCLWMPERIEEIDEDHLFRVLKAMEQSDKTGLLQRPYMIPETVDEWVEYLDSNPLPRDAVYVWNLDRIPPRERFFSPYLITHHGTELAARVLSRDNAGLIDPFYSVKTPDEPIQPDITVISEFVYTLLRQPGLTVNQKDFLLNLLNPSVSDEIPDRPEADDEELFQKALRYYRAGNISASLEFVDSLLEQTPNHVKARKLKIEILEKLRRYVEAAEMKHDMRRGEEKKPDQGSAAERVTPDDNAGTNEDGVEDSERETAADQVEPEAEASEFSEGDADEPSASDEESERAVEAEESVSETRDESSGKAEKSGSGEDDAEEDEETEKTGSDTVSESAEQAGAETSESDHTVKGAGEETGTESPDKQPAENRSADGVSGTEADRSRPQDSIQTTAGDFPETPHPEPEEIIASIIVPTTGDGKPALEQLFVSLSKYVDPRKYELIVVDNASLDDTHDYLEQLEKENYYNCTIITHQKNQGFARSVNAGLDQARGRYACILHNDVTLEDAVVDKLVSAMDENEELALLGPAADQTINPRQRTENLQSDEELKEVDYLDSFCMMLRMSADLRMDEQFELAYFEDVDLCFQARDRGYTVGVLPTVKVEHHQGVTTSGMGLDLDSRQYWYNASLFNEKWDIETELPEDMEERDEIEQLLILNERANPLYPEERFRQYFEELMTDEVKTRMLNKELDKDELLELVDLMLTMDHRDILRKLEDKIEDFELPPTLLYRLIRYYYERNIFSRCKHYLQQLPESEQSPFSRLYILQIAVSEKDMDNAIPLLSEIMDELPSHPEVYRQAAKIHQFEGNREETESFNELAIQIDPFHYEGDEVWADS